jgi:hypothetical protein
MRDNTLLPQQQLLQPYKHMKVQTQTSNLDLHKPASKQHAPDAHVSLLLGLTAAALT